MSFGGLRVDERVSEGVLRCLEPLGIEASLNTIEQECGAINEHIHQKELVLQQLNYEVAHARRQYDAVDPDNRLVAAELERGWNETLKTQSLLQEELGQLRRPLSMNSALHPPFKAEPPSLRLVLARTRSQLIRDSFFRVIFSIRNLDKSGCSSIPTSRLYEASNLVSVWDCYLTEHKR